MTAQQLREEAAAPVRLPTEEDAVTVQQQIEEGAAPTRLPTEAGAGTKQQRREEAAVTVQQMIEEAAVPARQQREEAEKPASLLQAQVQQQTPCRQLVQQAVQQQVLLRELLRAVVQQCEWRDRWQGCRLMWRRRSLYGVEQGSRGAHGAWSARGGTVLLCCSLSGEALEA